MNKTVNINLGGLFFHIDENAYQKLKHYLDAINNSLNDDPQEKEEIIKDIEQRIGELLSEKTNTNRQVVSENNIDEIITVMGQPEDYAYDDELFNEGTAKENKKKKKTKRNKKMYRDGKDKILGGVSSGLGHYFGIDVAWIRIILVATMFLGGSSVLVYIILWIILPEANSTADQLEMKGEPVNIDNIEKKIREEYSKIEDKVKNADYSKVKTGFQDMVDTLGKLLGGSLKVIGKLVGILLLVIASIVLIAGLIGIVFGGGAEILHLNNSLVQLPPFMEGSLIPRGISLILLVLAIVIPFIFLFVLGLNILSGKKKAMGTTANLSLLGIWIITLFGLVFVGVEFNSKYASKSSISANFDYQIAPKDTLRIVMQANHKITDRKNLFNANSYTEFVQDSLGIERLYSSLIDVDVRRSGNTEMMLKIVRSTKGFNKDNALKNAKSIDYYYHLTPNNILDLNTYFLTDTKLSNNSPRVKVIVYVPKGVYVYFDTTTQYFLRDIKNKQRIADRKMINHYFLMENIDFICTDCEEEAKKEEEEGVNLSVNNGKETAHVKIDSNGLKIK